MNARQVRLVVLDLLAAAVLLSVTIIGFAGSFDGPGYVVASVGALVAGLAIAWAGARWGWGVLSLAGATIGAYVVLGGPLALPRTTLWGVIPTLETLRQLA